MSIRQGRAALVTGAGSDIGRAIAIALAKEGASVMVQDIAEGSAKSTAQCIREMGGAAEAVVGNVAVPADCRRFVEEAVEKFGSIDILVNNAGIIRDALIYKMTDSEWESVVDINLGGAFYCTRETVKRMKEQKYGRVINISSIGYVGYRGQANYAASKAALIALARVTAVEYAWCGVTANCVCPGVIATDMTLNCMGGGDNWLNYVKETTLMGHPGRPEDVAYLVCALAADEAGFITGQTIAADGGAGRIRI